MIFFRMALLVLFFASSGICKDFSNIKFHKTEETLARIEEIISNHQKGAFFRFGDGDVNIVSGVPVYDCADQPKSVLFEREMREAFGLKGPTILKTLPLYCREFNGYEEGMFPGNHEAPYEWALDMLNRADPFWNIEPGEDIYSHVALHFAATQYPARCVEFLQFLKRSNCVLFIGDKNIPASKIKLLFGEQCMLVPTPRSRAYFVIDQIERECLEKVRGHNEYKVIITAMGCAGRALQKRLWNQVDNVFLFDFGSLIDGLLNLNSRAWIEVSHFNGDEFLKKLSN